MLGPDGLVYTSIGCPADDAATGEWTYTDPSGEPGGGPGRQMAPPGADSSAAAALVPLMSDCQAPAAAQATPRTSPSLQSSA